MLNSPATPTAEPPEPPETPETPGPIARKCADLLALIASARTADAFAQQVRACVIAALAAAQARHDAFALARLRRDLQDLDRKLATGNADARRLQGEIDQWIAGFPEPHRGMMRDRIAFAYAAQVAQVAPPLDRESSEGGR